jgi:polysaccharide biosynthesis/export protein
MITKSRKAGSDKVLPWLAVASACLWTSLLALAGNAGRGFVIQGVPGEVTCSSDSPLSVKNELGKGTVVWIVSSGGQTQIPKALSGCVRPVSGGIAIEVPLGASPKMNWVGNEMTLRWSPDTTHPASASGDVFILSSPPSYPLGPGDKLQVTVYNNVEDMNLAVTVDPNGVITFPVLDKVPVQGLTVTELQLKLEELLAQYVKTPQVSLQLVEYGSRFVNVLGQVRLPGRIPLKGAFKVLDAISQAGGFQDNSGDVEIQRRDASGHLQRKIFTKEELLTGLNDKGNTYVLDQDVVNVQMVKSVYVNGEVKSPGPFPYDKDFTLLRAITRAGGFTQWANKGHVDILREEHGVNKVIHVDAGDIEKGKIPDVPLLPNDQVVVKERKFF